MMLFKDIKQNYPVCILDKQEMTFKQGKVTNVSLPTIPKMTMQFGTNAGGRRYDGGCYDRS